MQTFEETVKRPVICRIGYAWMIHILLALGPAVGHAAQCLVETEGTRRSSRRLNRKQANTNKALTQLPWLEDTVSSVGHSWNSCLCRVRPRIPSASPRRGLQLYGQGPWCINVVLHLLQSKVRDSRTFTDCAHSAPGKTAESSWCVHLSYALAGAYPGQGKHPWDSHGAGHH